MWGKSILTMGSATDHSFNSILHATKSNDSTEQSDDIKVELQYTIPTAGSSTNTIQTKNVKIPIHSILLREIEMQETAVKFSIYKDQWSGSLFYRKWEESGNQFSIKLEEECMALKKDADGKPSKLTNTCLFTNNCIWDEWCVNLIEKFYRDGKLHIPSNVQGYDFLLLIEVFGILYQPHQLVYASYSAYINVRHWSNYFTNRMAMSCWIADYIDRHEKEMKSKVIQTTRLEFATSLTPDSEIVSLENALLPVIGQSDQEQSISSSSRVAVLDYDYFNGVSNAAKVGSISIDTANLMQNDFVLFLEHYLCDVIQNAKFVSKEVTIRTAENVAAVTTRAILVVEIYPSAVKQNQREKEVIAVHEIVTEVMVVDPASNNTSESREASPPITMMTIQGLSQGENAEIETIACMSQTSSKKVATTYNEKLSLSNDGISQHSPRGISDFDLFQTVPSTLKDDDDEQIAVESVKESTSWLNVQDEEQDIKITLMPTVAENDKSDLSKNDASSTRKVVFEVSQDLLSTVAPGDSEMSPLDVLDGKQFDLVTVPSALTTSFTVYDTYNKNIRTSAPENPGTKPALTDFVRSLFKQERNNVSEQQCSDQVGRWDLLVDMNACQFPQKLMENMQRCSVATNTTVRDSKEAENEITSAKLDLPMQKDIDNICLMDEFVSIDVVHVDGLPSDEVRTAISVTETNPEINKKQLKTIPTIKQHLHNVQNKINEGKLHFVRSATH